MPTVKLKIIAQFERAIKSFSQISITKLIEVCETFILKTRMETLIDVKTHFDQPLLKATFST